MTKKDDALTQVEKLLKQRNGDHVVIPVEPYGDEEASPASRATEVSKPVYGGTSTTIQRSR